ncbi:MAG: DUF624 domain-containing protein [Epulopiscium sp.]|nr:DUF624 domain-containing protein [Candidatus Epulonipiscium sp.]
MGRGLFDLDGPFNRFGTFVFDIIFLNMLWIIFSIPFVTIGASTTAMFYVTGKKIRKEEGYIFRDFWKSFKMNFKQSSVVWLLMVVVIVIAQFNLTNIGIFGKLGSAIAVFQFAVLLQMIIVGIYIFPLLSRLYLSLFNAFKIAFIMGNKHLLTTIISVILLATLFLVIFILPPILFVGVSFYALMVSFFMEKVLVKYLPEQKGETRQQE